MRVFVREVVKSSRGNDDEAKRASLPSVLFLQGGPGFEAGRPDASGGWIGELVNEHRVFLLDQRGTGRSDAELVRVPASAELGDWQPEVFVGGDADADWAKNAARLLMCFRADSIVKDAELIRRTLLGHTGENTTWTLLGQSFGGFCITTYLSFAPEGVKEALYTGGLPPLTHEKASAEGAYRELFKRVIAQNEKYYARFPQDIERVCYLLRYCSEHVVRLPGGGRLGATLIKALGFSNLGTASGMERLHFILENVVIGQPISHKVLIDIENTFRHFSTNPLYGILHESIYCNEGNAYGGANEAMKAFAREFDHTDVLSGVENKKVYFTGEMVFKEFFDKEFGVEELKPYARVRDVFASSASSTWSKLYDDEQLARTTAPVACASYVEDMFVDFNLAAETAAKIKGARVWSTSEYMHSGIREDGAKIVKTLLAYTREEDPIR